MTSSIPILSIRQESFSLTIGLHLNLLLDKDSTLDSDEDGQNETYKSSNGTQGRVDRRWVIVQWAMSECIESRLNELRDSRDASDRSVNAPERSETEDFSGVVTRMQVSN